MMSRGSDFEFGTRDAGLANDRPQRAQAEFFVVGYRDGCRSIGATSLHDNMTAAAAHLDKSVSR